MSMSIFSSFDALCAERFGQKVSLSWAPVPSNTNKQDPTLAAVKIDDLKKNGKEVNSSSSQQMKKPEDRRRMRAPRFAPELDGIYCFETILPY